MNTNESTLRVPSVVVTTSVVFVNNQSGCLRHLSADRRSTPDCLRHDDLVPRNVVSRQPQTAPPPRHPLPQLRWFPSTPPLGMIRCSLDRISTGGGLHLLICPPGRPVVEMPITMAPFRLNCQLFFFSFVYYPSGKSVGLNAF